MNQQLLKILQTVRIHPGYGVRQRIIAYKKKKISPPLESLGTVPNERLSTCALSNTSSIVKAGVSQGSVLLQMLYCVFLYITLTGLVAGLSLISIHYHSRMWCLKHACEVTSYINAVYIYSTAIVGKSTIQLRSQ